jgi:hypothetical protein
MKLGAKGSTNAIIGNEKGDICPATKRERASFE